MPNSADFVVGYGAMKLFRNARRELKPEVFDRAEAAAGQRGMAGPQGAEVLAVPPKIVMCTGKDIDQITAAASLWPWGACEHRDPGLPSRAPTTDAGREPMLVLTPAAVAVVNTLTTAEGRPEGAGLRISSDTGPAQGGLRVEITSGPAGRDQVLAEAGARVFLDPNAVSYLDDKVLDADIDESGRISSWAHRPSTATARDLSALDVTGRQGFGKRSARVAGAGRSDPADSLGEGPESDLSVHRCDVPGPSSEDAARMARTGSSTAPRS